MMDGDKKAGREGKKSKPTAAASGEEIPAKSRRGRHKKPKDMPSRPLSAYNLFFAKEREKILSAKREGLEQPDFLFPTDSELQQQASTGKKKPPAMFQALAKCVGGRWRALQQDDRKVYEDQAKEEMRLYREKMVTYQESVVMKSIAESEKNGERSDDEPDASDEKPPAKKAKISSEKTNRTSEKDKAMPPHQQVQIKTEGSPKTTETDMLPNAESKAVDGPGASAFSPSVQQRTFHQYSQQQPGANMLYPGLGGMDPSVGMPFAYQQGYTDPRGLPGPSMPFFNQQLPQSLDNIPRSAMGQNQNDMFRHHQAMLQHHQHQMQRALMGMPPDVGSADLAAFQQLQQQSQHARGGQGMFPSLYLQNGPHVFGMDAAQLGAAQSGAGVGAGGYRLADLLMRSQQQQQPQSQSQSNGPAANGNHFQAGQQSQQNGGRRNQN